MDCFAITPVALKQTPAQLQEEPACDVASKQNRLGFILSSTGKKRFAAFNG